jgi:hypothetical protein
VTFPVLSLRRMLSRQVRQLPYRRVETSGRFATEVDRG